MRKMNNGAKNEKKKEMMEMTEKKIVFTDSETGEKMTEEEFIEHADEVGRSPEKKMEYGRYGLHNRDPVLRYCGGKPFEPWDDMAMTVFVRFPFPCPVCGMMPVVESADKYVGKLSDEDWRRIDRHMKDGDPLRFWSVRCTGDVPIHHHIATRRLCLTDFNAIDEWNQAVTVNEHYTLEQVVQFRKFYFKEDEYAEEGEE